MSKFKRNNVQFLRDINPKKITVGSIVKAFLAIVCGILIGFAILIVWNFVAEGAEMVIDAIRGYHTPKNI